MTERRTFVALFFATIAATSCNDYPNQLVVIFDTDAPIAAGGGLDPLAPTPLFDRLRIDVQQPGQDPCAGCSGDFIVTREQFESGRVSIGVPLPASGTWVMRARLYLTRLANNGEPNSDATIDELVQLPPAADNPGQGGVFLATDTVGQSKDPAADPPDSFGTPAAVSAVGTWSGAAQVACDESSLQRPPNTTCVTGGAYWMGTQDGQAIPGRNATWHRLAVLSPFYLDTTEVTVAAYRASGKAVKTPNTPTDPANRYCTFTPAPGPYEALPVTCVTYAEARLYCQALGGDLPTGTQYEFAASRFGRAPYVWGFDEPVACAAAVWGNCPTTSCFFNGGVQEPPDPCFSLSSSPLRDAQGQPLGGPVPAPSCAAPCSLDPFRDVLPLHDADVVDLAGNVAEITRDRPFSGDDGCYAGHVLVDPACPITTGEAQIRGGAFDRTDFASMRADVTETVLAAAKSAPFAGFRCAYPATPLGQ